MAKILIIDDSVSFRMQLKETLEQAGHGVIEGSDGIHGLEVLEKNADVGLILCDLNMPRMDGMTFCRTVKERTELPRAPIVILTTEASPALKQEAKELGVRGWIIKPFEPGKLIAGVEFLLKKKS